MFKYTQTHMQAIKNTIKIEQLTLSSCKIYQGPPFNSILYMLFYLILSAFEKLSTRNGKCISYRLLFNLDNVIPEKIQYQKKMDSLHIQILFEIGHEKTCVC